MKKGESPEFSNKVWSIVTGSACRKSVREGAPKKGYQSRGSLHHLSKDAII